MASGYTECQVSNSTREQCCTCDNTHEWHHQHHIAGFSLVRFAQSGRFYSSNLMVKGLVCMADTCNYLLLIYLLLSLTSALSSCWQQILVIDAIVMGH